MVADSSMPLRTGSARCGVIPADLRPVAPISGEPYAIIASLVKPVNKPRPAHEQVSELTTNRLSIYLRCLTELEAAGVETISSQALAEQFKLNAAQIRKDLAYFGEFGVRGVGYYVKDLRRDLRQILGLDRKLRVAIIGAGNLGLALADYPGFRQEGFEIVALFDKQNDKVGHVSRGGVADPRHPSAEAHRAAGAHEHRRHRRARHPRHSTSSISWSRPGIKAILNFSPGALNVPAGREAEERRPDGVAREPLVLSRARRSGRPKHPPDKEADGQTSACDRARLARAHARRLVGPPADGGCRRQAGHRTRGGGTGCDHGERGRARLVRSGQVRKGDPLEAARLAGIMAAKRTSELIPLCHPIALTHVDVDIAPTRRGYRITATARTTAQTGVEMEALTAVVGAALTIYDMLKAVDREMVIGEICLVEKSGGRSGHYRRAAVSALGRPCLRRCARGNRPPADLHLADDVLLRHHAPVPAVGAVVAVVAHHEVVALGNHLRPPVVVAAVTPAARSRRAAARR